VLPRMTRRVITYGVDSTSANIGATDIVLRPFGVSATVVRRPSGRESATTSTLGSLTLKVPGRHNLSNALACAAVGLELGLSFDQIASGLSGFRGAERRFEVRGEPRGILVVDDYGHHPTEIAAVIAAARTLDRRIIVAFQPHRFSRTAALKSAFGPSLADADHVVLTDIYAAGEDPIPGVTVDALAAAIRERTGRPVDVVARLSDVAPALARLARPGDLVITLGAGSIGSVPESLIELLSQPEPRPTESKERR
jgi:UDP-N-acetylmuramate--alanine ligase